MKKNLYLLRHGQTLFNSKHLISGWSDSPLTEKGIEQAKRAGLFFQNKGVHFDHLYCSDLHRAVTTSKLVAPNLAPEIKQPLREWFFGYYEAERVAIMPQAPFEDYFCQFGGEAQSTVRDRMFNCIHDIMEQDDAECVLVVSHGRSCKEFYDAVLGEAANPNDKVPGNCGAIHFSYEDGEFSVVDLFTLEDYARELQLPEID